MNKKDKIDALKKELSEKEELIKEYAEEFNKKKIELQKIENLIAKEKIEGAGILRAIKEIEDLV